MHIPFSEKIKSIPGAIGIRLEEELPYTVVNNMGDLELRVYDAFTLARTTCSGRYEAATDMCFRTLAEFIFGKNTEAKVTQMTTPVFIDREVNKWTMSFFLPDEISHLKPLDSSIEIEMMPSKDVAVFGFSGIFNEMSMEESRRHLLALVAQNGLVAESDVWWAQFDQPVSLPFTKRNEALVKVTLPM